MDTYYTAHKKNDSNSVNIGGNTFYKVGNYFYSFDGATAELDSALKTARQAACPNAPANFDYQFSTALATLRVNTTLKASTNN